MADQPPPEPNFHAVLPRYQTAFVEAVDRLLAMIHRRAPSDDVGREFARVAQSLRDDLDEAEQRLQWSDFDDGEGPDFLSEEETAAALDTLERARASYDAGDINGALALIERDARARFPEHIEKAYRLAMEQKHAV